MRLELEKYTYIFDEGTGKSEALRNNLKWRNCTGDNLLLSMAQKIEHLEEEFGLAVELLENSGVDYDEVVAHLKGED